MDVRTRCLKVSGVRLVLEQSVMRGEETLTRAEVTLATVDASDYRPVPVPEVIKQMLNSAENGTDRELKKGAETL
jgi:acyl-CoA thioesterase FadM